MESVSESNQMLARSGRFYTNFMDRLQELTSYLSNETVFSVESLLDAFIALYTDCKSMTPQSEYITAFVEKCKYFGCWKAGIYKER